MRADKGGGELDVPHTLADEWEYYSLCRAGMVGMSLAELEGKPEGFVRRLGIIVAAETQFKRHKGA